MSDQTSFISQIKEEEAKAAKMIEGVGFENDASLSKANEEAESLIAQAEDEERVGAKERILKAKEEAKANYSKLLVDADNARRDVIENGKSKIIKGKSKVVESFMAMFQ